ncbi:TMEM198/TM7SF3 family protein [Streptomyces sp. BPSDS2]|uniref:TMEM198/TM7SF3 family protein n=1 Tax=Streptomyces sp. BPSDS2 TaxID=2571021 RepID=UPI0010C1EF05|nr:TMEM198/TM7SF3 family protein [Streptomyces sp. BPSDS2]
MQGLEDPQEDRAALLDALSGVGRDVAELKAQQEHDRAGLARGLSSLRTDVSGVEAQLESMADDVSRTETSLRAVRETTEATHRALEDFVERYGRDQIVAHAQADLTRLTIEWTARFAQRQHTRALARGLAHALTEDALARQLTDSATIEACLKGQFLLEPTFWLAPAVLAVAAELTGDSRRAARARSHALTLGQDKATLFFALISSRRKMQTEAAHWMDQYLGGLDASDLGEEFRVVLEAVACAELGYDALSYARQAMIRWDRERNARIYARHQGGNVGHLIRWEPWIVRRTEVAATDFDALRRLSGDGWERLEEGWETASAVQATAGFLRESYSEQPTEDTENHRSDAALRHLIGQLDPDESEVQEQMRRLKRIIADGGRTPADELSGGVTDPTDFGTLLEQAVFEPKAADLEYPARLLALHSAWPSLRAAVAMLTRRSRSLVPDHLDLHVDGWSCQLPTSSDSPDERERLLRELGTYLDDRTSASIRAVAPLWPRILGGLACALLGVMLGLWLEGSGGGVVITVALFVLLYAVWGVVSVPVRRLLIRQDGTRRRIRAAADLTAAFDQHAALMQQWQSGLAAAARFGSWSPSPGYGSVPRQADAP